MNTPEPAFTERIICPDCFQVDSHGLVDGRPCPKAACEAAWAGEDCGHFQCSIVTRMWPDQGAA